MEPFDLREEEAIIFDRSPDICLAGFFLSVSGDFAISMQLWVVV
jgi:hypothetical protein